ncbi:hypothetical protein DKM44_13525 [Deinococcus irradiatisoli]|uniref:Uncharacterized protein n=1 Tax=Deinococcus irradiatisoli TaxID=2202254 RepID=A0A2Z3JS34_9DEIO|nr:hypothetical protein [Deinococcus irradiatisoli]AWN24118.1 hypothetical protein DKM44_13525 [Deinococcus irradiatisoli]
MNREFLQRRNALWQRLRLNLPEEPGADSQVFETALTELSILIQWDHSRILAGLGQPDEAEAEGERP